MAIHARSGEKHRTLPRRPRPSTPDSSHTQGTVILVRRKIDGSYFVIKRILGEHHLRHSRRARQYRTLGAARTAATHRMPWAARRRRLAGSPRGSASAS